MATNPRIEAQLAASPEESEHIHRRESLHKISFPVLMGVLALVGLIAGVLTLPNWLPYPSQVAMVANVLTCLFILLPMALCMLPLYLILFVAAFGLGSFHKTAAFQLRRVNRMSRGMATRTINASTAVDKRVINWRVKLAGFEAAIESAFEPRRPELDSTVDESRDES